MDYWEWEQALLARILGCTPIACGNTACFSQAIGTADTPGYFGVGIMAECQHSCGACKGWFYPISLTSEHLLIYIPNLLLP